MATREIFVCEKDGGWTSAVRRFVHETVRVRETRSLLECRDRLCEIRDAFVVLEVTRQSLSPVLSELVRLRPGVHRAPVAVVANRSLWRAEWSLREAGAVHVVFSPRRVNTLCHMALRHFCARQAMERGCAAVVVSSDVTR